MTTETPIKKPVQTVALSRNVLYTTYQFHGLLGKGRDPDATFRAGIAEVFAWLRSRFREFDTPPAEICFDTGNEPIDNTMIRSFHISDGYVIETVYVPEESLWAFRLTEPDMGTSGRASVPGRLFTTNYGLRIVEGNVEFGCRLVCTQPEIIEEDAEVFRPKLIRDLNDTLGLFSIVDLKYEANDLSAQGVRKKLDDLLKDPAWQMPVVVLTQKTPSVGDPVWNVKIGRTMWKEAADRWARSLCGIAYVFFQGAGEEGSVSIHYPPHRTLNVAVTGDSEGEVLEQLWTKTRSKVSDWTKRNDLLSFGNVLFLDDARKVQRELELKRLMETNGYEQENENLRQAVRQLENEKKMIEQLSRDFSNKYREERELRQQIERSSSDKERQWKDKIAELDKEARRLQRELEDRENTIQNFESKALRPTDILGFLHWVETFHADDILILPRAKEELKKSKFSNIDMLCDAIEVLAKDYKAWRTGVISEEDCIRGCKSRGRTAFEISATGDASIQRFAELYKVYYGDPGKDKSKRRALDMHLKSGVDARFLLRIYFFWDKEKQLVVIGSLPEHLQTIRSPS